MQDSRSPPDLFLPRVPRFSPHSEKGEGVAAERQTRRASAKEREQTMRQRGVFEKLPGSGVWWIRYADSMGRIRREKAGTKSSALTLYRKRKTEALQGKKLPESLRTPAVSFAEIARDALAYSRVHKRTYDDDKIRMETLLAKFRDHNADSIT